MLYTANGAVSSSFSPQKPPAENRRLAIFCVVVNLIALSIPFYLLQTFNMVPSTPEHVPHLYVRNDPRPKDTEYPLKPKSRENDTIILLYASFRDFDCHRSILSAFEMSEFPHRLRFGIFQQHADVDVDCDNFTSVCPSDHPACSAHENGQIRIRKVAHTEAKGPTWGRAMQDQLIGDDEIFALQVDAHVFYVKHWDTLAIDMWMNLNNEYAVLSTYVKDVSMMNKETHEARDKSYISVVCNTHFKGLHGMPRHSTGGLVKNPFKDPLMPLMSPVWCAGLSFSAAHRVREVPYDPYTPQVFDGEEFLMTAKLWTHGYDFYTTGLDICFHPYGREKAATPQPLFQSVNPQATWNTAKHATIRIRHVLDMPPPSLEEDGGVRKPENWVYWENKITTCTHMAGGMSIIKQNDEECKEECLTGAVACNGINFNPTNGDCNLKLCLPGDFRTQPQQQWHCWVQFSEEEPDKTEIDRYGVGTVRSLSDFYEQRKINIKNLTSKNICDSITSGNFHRTFHPQEYRSYVPPKDSAYWRANTSALEQHDAFRHMYIPRNRSDGA